jgi:hypothetical protein
MKYSISEVDLASIYNLPIRPVEHIISSLWSSNIFLSAGSGVLVLKVKRCICRIAMFASASNSHAPNADNDYVHRKCFHCLSCKRMHCV